jgi:Xaa-Pro aminopeptidase
MVSDKERERRHRATRVAMERAGIDVLVAISDAHHKGDVYYLTNHTIWSQRGYAVMTQEAGPILVVAMASQDYWARKESWAAEVKWSASPVREVVATLRGLMRPGQTVGISGLRDLLPLSDYEHLREQTAGLSIADATDVMQSVRAKKSAEELAELRESAEVANAGFAVLREYGRPGIQEFELVGEVERVVRARGAGATLILTSQGPYLRSPSARKLQAGDFQMFSVELCGPSGYWVEVGGMLAIGDIDTPAALAYEACRRAFDAGINAIRTGQKCATVAAILVDAFKASNHKAGIWGGHGIGLDTLEQPRLTAADDTVISEGMVFGFHPHVVDSAGIRGAYIADTVIVTPDGPVRLGHPDTQDSLVLIGGHTA